MSDQTKRKSDTQESHNPENDPDVLFDDPMAEIYDEDEFAEEADNQEMPPRSPADVLQALNEENTELKNKVMSVLADMENLRRRTEREVKDARQYAVANFARDLLSVSDNLARALQAIPEEVRAQADDALKNLLEGVEMTDRDLQNQLSKNGVMQLDPKGDKFDPNFHQAIFEVPNTEIPNGTVVEVVQAGYKIGERVLRPAMVGVSKGGPKIAAEDTQASPSGVTVDKSV